MQVQTLVLRFEHAAGNVGAVVCHTLEVCEQVRPDEAGFQTARAFLKPRDLARAQLVLQTVNDLLKRFDAACRGQVSGPEGGETQMDDFLHGVLERRQFLLRVGREGDFLGVQLLGDSRMLTAWSAMR